MRFLDRGVAKHDKELFDQGPGHILHEIVVCMATGQHDVEYQSERARDDDLVPRKLGHRDVQCFAGIGLRGVERDALDGSLRLHGAQRLFTVAWKEVRLHSHSIYVF